MLPSLVDGDMKTVTEFPKEGYAVHADLVQTGKEQIIIYDAEEAVIYSSSPMTLSLTDAKRAKPQLKRLYNSTLYPGGEVKISGFTGHSPMQMVRSADWIRVEARSPNQYLS